MTRPKIIIHMHTSLNGKINGPHLRSEESQASQVEYYTCSSDRSRSTVTIAAG